MEQAKFPEYALESNRLKSYQTWSIFFEQKPPTLAKAGFYYKGFKDCVQCFFCSGCLYHWEPNQDPWIEHARYFPNCGFLLTFVQELHKHHIAGLMSNNIASTTLNILQQPSEANTPLKLQTRIEEHEQLKKKYTCRICMYREVQILFRPCSHLICCSICVRGLENCPICGAKIMSYISSKMS